MWTWESAQVALFLWCKIQALLLKRMRAVVQLVVFRLTDSNHYCGAWYRCAATDHLCTGQCELVHLCRSCANHSRNHTTLHLGKNVCAQRRELCQPLDIMRICLLLWIACSAHNCVIWGMEMRTNKGIVLVCCQPLEWTLKWTASIWRRGLCQTTVG